ncbi:MAG: DUF1810 domain-containing protein [Casimicrobiaceae bacterium]
MEAWRTAGKEIAKALAPMTVAADDPFNLKRFIEAQAKDYSRALAELRAGKKQTHWIWYVLPQLRGLGTSSYATFYGIASAQEARAYLAHPILGPRLRECVGAMNALVGVSAVQVLGETDAAKFRSCLTLFLAAHPEDAAFSQASENFFAGAPDEKSLALLDLSQNVP